MCHPEGAKHLSGPALRAIRGWSGAKQNGTAIWADSRTGETDGLRLPGLCRRQSPSLRDGSVSSCCAWAGLLTVKAPCRGERRSTQIFYCLIRRRFLPLTRSGAPRLSSYAATTFASWERPHEAVGAPRRASRSVQPCRQWPTSAGFLTTYSSMSKEERRSTPINCRITADLSVRETAPCSTSHPEAVPREQMPLGLQGMDSMRRGQFEAVICV
jgi:hypothetical protein